MATSLRQTVTFLFTDIEGSTHLLQQFGDDFYAQIQSEHRRLIRQAVMAQGGREQETQGDGFLFTFQQASAAVQAAVGAQQALHDHAWPDGVEVRVRMGLHTGIPVTRDEGYVGLDVHRAARICQAGWGGQILLSEGTQAELRAGSTDSVNLRDLGSHRLKDLQQPEKIFQILHPDLLADFPPLRSLDRLPNNLPVQLTSFIGREQEIAEIKRLLAHTRLLTLTGPGGIGKTRLALQVAAELADDYSDGIWLVELAPLTDPELVARTVAGALHVREQPGRQLVETLIDYLRPRQPLLVLDNSEHLVTACASLVDTLLRNCPNLRVLATSREPLRMLGETTWPVPSLPVPQLEAKISPDALRRSEAVRLFVDRAAAIVPRFSLTDENAPGVAEICRRLDGIPLAIELAAARIKILPPDEIAARLDDRFRLLTGGSRSVLPRQQTLQATLDWSYHLLSEPERIFLRRLSVFAGGFTLEAAEAICGVDPLDHGDVLDLLERLVEKSLVVALGQNGAIRYGMLETVRVYGRDKLEESGKAAAMRDRHLRWFADLAERAWSELFGPDQAAWLDRLEGELGNIRAALEWSTAGEGSVQDGLRLAGSLPVYWSSRGHVAEGRAWLEALLARDRDPPTSARARALFAAGNAAGFQGDFDAEQAFGIQGVAVSKALDDKENHAWALTHLAGVAMARREFDSAEAFFEEAVAIGRPLGADPLMEGALTGLGETARLRGEYERAVRYYEESLALAKRIGDRWVVCSNHGNIGYSFLGLGDYARGAPMLRECLVLARQLNERWLMSWLLDAFAWILGRHGQPALAASMFGTADATLKELGMIRCLGDIPDVERQMDYVRGVLGEEAYNAAHAEGEKITLEQALETALKQIETLHLSSEAPA